MTILFAEIYISAIIYTTPTASIVSCIVHIGDGITVNKHAEKISCLFVTIAYELWCDVECVKWYFK